MVLKLIGNDLNIVNKKFKDSRLDLHLGISGQIGSSRCLLYLIRNGVIESSTR